MPYKYEGGDEAPKDENAPLNPEQPADEPKKEPSKAASSSSSS